MRTLRLLRLALQGFQRHEAFFLAAGLSFYFMICLIPLLFLTVSLAGFILSTEAASRYVIGLLAQYLPVYKKEIANFLAQLIAARRVSGVLGTLILVIFSTQVFASVRLVLNQILEVKGRSFWRGMLFDCLMILLIAACFFATIGMTTLYGWFQREMRPLGLPVWLWDWSWIALTFFFSAGMFFLVYRFVPNRWVSNYAALTGALVASLLWEIAKQLFRLYIQEVGVYDRIYGPMGILMALIMLIYYSALVFVFGAELIREVEDA
ncbi:MAG TPA: YihY/virulence factor BrkB family protein [Methylomirabilota bacterium]|nr:YihY/virulence factor BrkB family protein [Methylomirabilota bacterium]